MDVDTLQTGTWIPDTSINYQVEFSNKKRVRLVFLGPVVIMAGFVLGFLILGIFGFGLVVFGLWMPIYGITGYAEMWRFEPDAITRIRRNPLWKDEKRWEYSVVRGVRIKEFFNHIHPELLIRGKGWLSLPEQADRETAERLKTLIGNFKRATMADDSVSISGLERAASSLPPE